MIFNTIMSLFISISFAQTSNNSNQSLPHQCTTSEEVGTLAQMILKNIDDVEDVGFFASTDSTHSMCEEMFLVGGDMFLLGTIASGVGYGKPNKSITQCAQKLNHIITQKMSSLTRFKKRCQKLVDQHPLLLTGGCKDNDWCDKYWFGARALGFDMKWENQVHN